MLNEIISRLHIEAVEVAKTGVALVQDVPLQGVPVAVFGEQCVRRCLKFARQKLQKVEKVNLYLVIQGQLRGAPTIPSSILFLFIAFLSLTSVFWNPFLVSLLHTRMFCTYSKPLRCSF